MTLLAAVTFTTQQCASFLVSPPAVHLPHRCEYQPWSSKPHAASTSTVDNTGLLPIKLSRDQDAIDSFLSWLKTNGFDHSTSPLELRQVEGERLGVR